MPLNITQKESSCYSICFTHCTFCLSIMWGCKLVYVDSGHTQQTLLDHFMLHYSQPAQRRSSLSHAASSTLHQQPPLFLCTLKESLCSLSWLISFQLLCAAKNGSLFLHSSLSHISAQRQEDLLYQCVITSGRDLIGHGELIQKSLRWNKHHCFTLHLTTYESAVIKIFPLQDEHREILLPCYCFNCYRSVKKCK